MEGETVSAVLEGVVVGVATVHTPLVDEPDDVRPLTLRVDPGWQRRGIGSRLLVDSCRLAHMHGAIEVVLTARSDNQAVLPMVLAAGMRGRIRLAADVLTVRVPVRDLEAPSGLSPPTVRPARTGIPACVEQRRHHPVPDSRPVGAHPLRPGPGPRGRAHRAHPTR